MNSYNWEYDGLDEDYIESGLDRAINNWADVDDFKWLNPCKHSPNWSLLPTEERVESWADTDVLTSLAGPGKA